MKRVLLFLLLVAGTAHAAPRRILIYTRNGVGYVHQNIHASAEAMSAIATRHGFQVDVTDDPTVFTQKNLKRYAVLVFANTNNQAFTSQTQRDAFQHFIQSGGGLLGIHSAAGSERDWPYFAHVMGGRFVEHPPIQQLHLQVAASEPFTKGMPQQFERKDECYFYADISPTIHPLLSVSRADLTGVDKMKLNAGQYPALLPVAWYQTVDGGREFYLGLGHSVEDYQDPILLGFLERGLLWAADTPKR